MTTKVDTIPTNFGNSYMFHLSMGLRLHDLKRRFFCVTTLCTNGNIAITFFFFHFHTISKISILRVIYKIRQREEYSHAVHR